MTTGTIDFITSSGRSTPIEETGAPHPVHLSPQIHQGLSNSLTTQTRSTNGSQSQVGARTSYARLSRAIRRTEAWDTRMVATFRKIQPPVETRLGHAGKSRTNRSCCSR